MTEAVGTRPLGKPRGIAFGILIFIVTFGIYGLYWTYKTHEEIKQHTGEGVGGVVGLVIYILVSIVTPFVIPSEVGKLYRRDGKEPPVSGWAGLWILLPIAGIFVWFVKVQGALNRYWESKGAQPA
jgi:amino acid transporter